MLALAAIVLWRALPPGLEISWALDVPAPESFRVYRSPVNGSSGDDFSLIGELPVEAGVDRYDYIDLRLVPGQRFKYQVEAVDGSGNAITSQALIGDTLEALPRQLIFFAIFAVLLVAIVSMVRQYKETLPAPFHFAP